MKKQIMAKCTSKREKASWGVDEQARGTMSQDGAPCLALALRHGVALLPTPLKSLLLFRLFSRAPPIRQSCSCSRVNPWTEPMLSAPSRHSALSPSTVSLPPTSFSLAAPPSCPLRPPGLRVCIFSGCPPLSVLLADFPETLQNVLPLPGCTNPALLSVRYLARALPRCHVASRASLDPGGELIGMVPREGPESAQRLCPSLAGLNAKDVLRRKHKMRSRQHQRFMARKALLQVQGLLSTPAGPGSSPLPARPEARPEALPGSEATSSRMQRPRNESGGASCSRKPTPRESTAPWPSKCVAIDCEMVGTGPRGRVSELARCSVVSYHGDVLYDKYIRPEMPIVDYRTRWSGITRQHMRTAIPFQVAQKEILKLLKGKVVVGHALHNDFQALKYVHPRSQTRDTTYVPNLLQRPGLHTRTRVSLKDLALQLLHKKIQAGRHGHSSVEDAMTAMELYRLVEVQWEQQEASSLPACREDREPDSGTDTEQYMEDRYWPEDLAQGPSGGAGDAQDRGE